MTEVIDSAGYLRMSSDQQELSIDQQRKEIHELAARSGYRIVKEYVDSGKSGSLEIAKRRAFLQMIADSSQRKWSVILCWDMARFGRLDPLKAAQYKDTLRTNNVHLHTVKEGIVKWDVFTDFVVDVIHSAAANQYSKSLSKDTIRGRLDLLASGQWPNGKVPYGYDRLYVSGEGKEYKVGRNETFKKASGWKRYLTLNTAEADTVRWMYHQYLTHDLSLRGIAAQITGPRPDGKAKPWTKDTVKETLRNKIYAGFAFIGEPSRQRAKEVHNRTGYHEVAGAVPAIVTLQDWERATAKIAKNREENRKVKPATSSPLSGALVCGHCEYRLEKHSRTDAKGNRYTYFSCSSAIKRPQLGCKQWRIREDWILPIATEWLVSEVDKAVLEQSQSRPEDKAQVPTELESLQKALAEVKARIDRGTANYLEAPPKLKKTLEAKLTEWQEEQEELERRQRNLTVTDGEVSDFAKWWTKVKSDLVIVQNYDHTKVIPMEGADGVEEVLVHNVPMFFESSRFRQVLRDLEFKITVFWKPDGDRFFQIDYLTLSANGKEPEKHATDAINSRYSRVHILDKD